MKQAAAGKSISPNLPYQLAKWSIFAILILTYILVFFHRMAPGVVSEFLMTDFTISATRLGTLSAIYFVVYALMQIPSGVIADTLGTRTSIVSGNLVAGLGSILFGLAPSFEMACFGRFMVGLGVSVVFVSIMKSNSIWFHEKVFGMMSGVTLLLGNLGSIIAAAPLSYLLTLFQWRSIFLGIGCFSLCLALLGFLMVRRPEDMGFLPPNSGTTGKGLPAGSWLKNLKNVITTTRVWPGFWVQLGMVGGLYSFMGLWGIPFLRDVYGLTRAHAANHMTVMLMSFALGSFFFGWFSDRIGSRKPLLVAGVIGYILSWLILIYIPWSPGLSGFLLFGFMGFSGSGFVLTFAAAKEIIHPQLSGMAVSVVNTGCFIGTAAMQPLFGYLADLTWSGTMENQIPVYAWTDYKSGFMAMVVFSLVALAGALCVRETHCRNQEG
jgi:MFS family permease